MSTSALYRLLDCGNQRKLELIGPYKVIRPCPQAMWKPISPEIWEDFDVEFVRTGEEKGAWKQSETGHSLPKQWVIESFDGLTWGIEPNEFGNIGVFTEHWLYAPGLKDFFKPKGNILNLFTYSGSNCVTLAKAGMRITAVDSSRSAMTAYNANLERNGVPKEGQRMILEDAFKFIAREERRESKYDAIMIDAPSYGRGTKGEVFRIEDHLIDILETCKNIINDDGKVVLTLHSPRFTPAILQIMVSQIFEGRNVVVEEILQSCESEIKLPSGILVKIG